eukprot:2247052-Rhodomonas_salina.2
MSGTDFAYDAIRPTGRGETFSVETGSTALSAYGRATPCPVLTTDIRYAATRMSQRRSRRKWITWTVRYPHSLWCYAVSGTAIAYGAVRCSLPVSYTHLRAHETEADL